MKRKKRGADPLGGRGREKMEQVRKGGQSNYEEEERREEKSGEQIKREGKERRGRLARRKMRGGAGR